jgi:hypothetical protein
MIRFRLPQKRELLSLLDERSVADCLHGARSGMVQASPISPPVTYLPCRYPDGSTDDVSRSLDVIADALAAPKEAAPDDFPDAA